MKKTLVALAALAATSAFAQSSVTISGNVDASYQTIKEDGIAFTGDNAGLGAVASDMSGTDAASLKTKAPFGNGAQGWSSSALNLDVVEDLGNGTKAGYSAGMNLFSWGAGADAANQTFNTGRHSYVFLGDAKLGEVRAGYMYTLNDQVQARGRAGSPNVGGRVQNFALKVQPTYVLGSGQVAREGNEVMTSGAITRANAVEYATPVINGLQGLVQWAKTKADATDAGGTDGRNTGSLTSVALKYDNGPLHLGFASTTGKSDVLPANTVGTDNYATYKAKLQDLSAAYDIGAATLYANHFKRTTDLTTVVTGTAKKHVWEAFSDGGSVDRKGTDIGLKYAIGNTTLYAATGRGTYSIDYDGSGATDIKIKARLLAATYNLSKRTQLNAFSTVTKAAADGTVLETNVKKTVTGFGLAHSF